MQQLLNSRMVSTFIRIPGYRVTEEIYKGSRTLVYRGYREADSLAVVLKLLKNPYPSFNELLWFRNQYTIAKNLNSQLIIQTYSLEAYQNGYVLVMEDFGGISLQDWKVKGRQQSLQAFLAIGIAVCDILNILYRERIIHKDIKPRNILINPETKQVKLIDFSIASLLPRETQTLMNPKVLEGTLAYISPEQTGRMNRGIDYRTDFYSLGVTFYELLTGKLPFLSDDVMELVHFHIAKPPPLVHEVKSEIPLVISKIVNKLMAKNAEDRYQSALGLKFDLEKCWHQLQENGRIKGFEIGQRDVSDRFLIPDKLYGRDQQVHTLLSAFERVANAASELMLVAGFSGIGKTAVVNEVHKPIVRCHGYFIKGKYDQFNRNIPFSAFVQAFRDLMGQLLSESDEQLAHWKDKILQVLGDNGQVLIEVIPELEQIIGKQPLAPELSGSAAQNRFNLLFQKFIGVLTTPEHPLVMFLDDLQWADSASLNLMQVLLSGSEQGYLFIIGAYRDNEVFPAHPLMLTLEEIKKARASIHTLTLAPLSQSDINCLIADTLSCSKEVALPLTELVYQKTRGNPFFTTQFLKSLHQEGYIAFEPQAGHWQCDMATVRSLALTDDVVEFMAIQLLKLPPATQSVLKLAACIGAQFDLATLAIISRQTADNVALNLWKALQEGLILPVSEVYKFYQPSELSSQEPDLNRFNCSYRFLHDRVQQAAYSLIPEDQKPTTHLKIGQLLQKNLSEIEKEEKLFDIVGHLNLAIESITQPSEREALARLNLAAGQKARNSTAYSAARSFVQTGLELLSANCWQSQYELTLNLSVAAAETAYLNADFEGMEAMAAQVLQSAQTILDKVKIYELQISALIAQSRMLESIALGRNALKELGVEFPCEPDEALTGIALQTVATQLQGKQIEELVNLPVMSDSRTIATMQLLAILFAPILGGSPALLPLLCSKMVSLSLEFGNTPTSTIGYIGYGLVLSTVLGEVEKGYRFGQLAINVLNQLNMEQFKCITLLLFSCYLQHRQESLRATIPTSKAGVLAGMETGDFLFAGYTMSVYFDDKFFAGVELEDWEPELETYCLVLAQMKQDSALAFLKIKQQMVHHLREIAAQPDFLSCTAYDETVMIPKHHQDSEIAALAVVYIHKLLLAYIFGNITHALDYIAQVNLYLRVMAGSIQFLVFHFYAGLTYLAAYTTQSEIEQANTLALVETHQTTLAEWAHHAPMNHQHKVDLVEAEKCRVLGQKAAALELYDKAIASAKANNYIQEAALANELAAKFYLDWGKERIAGEYMVEAYYGYARWGAKAKVADLEHRYPQLLAPILEQKRSTLSVNETVFALGTPTSSSTSSSISDPLDLTAILKASQNLSSEIELDKLLCNLLHTVIQTAGADQCVLMLLDDKDLMVTAAAELTSSGQIEAQVYPTPLPVQDSLKIPISLVNIVKRSLQPAVIIDATVHPPLASDTYIQTRQPKSILCSPILHQGKLLGMVYLENNLVTGAFSGDRVQLLTLLCAQAAISLENAHLYRRSQNYAQQLERSLNDLNAAQSRFHNLVDNVPGVVYQFRMAADGTFALSYISAECYSLYEITPEQATAKTEFLTEMVHPDDLASYQQSGTDTIQTLSPWHWSGRIVTPSGLVKWIRGESRVQRQADGSIIWDGLFLDISDRKQAEFALQQKSLELEQALHNLQQAQLQIVQSEKMSALGNLVAGIAHEMNNPLGFIAASLQQTQPILAELTEHLKLYQETFPNSSDEIKDHADEIDFEYTLEDLPKVINSMTMACERLKNISTSLRIFSRADQDYKVPFNIHEGIDITLLILKHRLKANEQRPAIEVITDYGNLPHIKCFFGQLNQVFMNILANAIDALEESNNGRSFEEIRAKINQIKITTSAENHQIKITITDNGKGMSAEVKEKIFDHLFTTKAVGKGTGLGLAIAQQIVVEKHQGTITVNSTLGTGTECVIILPVN